MINIKKLNKKYDDRILFEDFNLKVDDGDFLWIYGESGAGKSTLLNIVGMLDKNYEGEVSILNHINPDISKDGSKILLNDLSYLFQNYGLIDNESVYYNFNIIDRVKKSKDKKKDMLEALKFLGLEHIALDQKIYTLSGGEQQRIAIGKILLKKPKIILCDEPTGSLDIDNAKKIMGFLKHLNDQGSTILIVSHDDMVAEYVNRKVKI